MMRVLVLDLLGQRQGIQAPLVRYHGDGRLKAARESVVMQTED